MQQFEKQSAFRVVTLLAVLISLYLVWHHIAFHSGYQRTNTLCQINQLFDCGKIERSSYSKLFGIPVASFALLFYMTFSAFACLVSNRSGTKEQTFAAVTLFASTVGMLVSLTFAVISFAKIGAICLFCTLLYLISLVLFLLACSISSNKKQLAAQLMRGGQLVITFFIPIIGMQSAVDKLPRLRWLSLLSLGSLAALIYAIPPAIETQILIPRAQAFFASEEAEAALNQWLAQPQQDIAVRNDPVIDRDFALGPADAPVTIVEYSDFECPHCQMSASKIHELLERYPGKVRLVFKHYPLDTACNRHLPNKLHLFACRAAAMNRCAGVQNPELFFPMADALFALGDDFSDESLGVVANEVGLNLEDLAACLADPQTIERIKVDIEEAARLGIQGTPSFFVNGRLVPGHGIDMLPVIIEHLLNPSKR